MCVIPPRESFKSLLRPSNSCLLQEDFSDHLGFGFDPRTRKYELVWYVFHWCKESACIMSMGMEVLVLGMPGWRVVEEDFTLSCDVSHCLLYFDGAVSWKISKLLRTSHLQHLFFFNPRDEKSRAIPVPPGYPSYADDRVNLTEFKGHLCFFFHNEFWCHGYKDV